MVAEVRSKIYSREAGYQESRYRKQMFLVYAHSMKQIISASRRTDIPRFYSQWFSERRKAGYVNSGDTMHNCASLGLWRD